MQETSYSVCVLFPRATSQVDALARIFGDCREGRIPRDGDCQGMRYAGSIYCSKSTDEGMTVYQMDLNGQNAEEVCYFEDRGEIAVYGGISIVTFTEKWKKSHGIVLRMAK